MDKSTTGATRGFASRWIINLLLFRPEPGRVGKIGCAVRGGFLENNPEQRTGPILRFS